MSDYVVSAADGDLGDVTMSIVGEVNAELSDNLRDAAHEGGAAARTYLRGNAPRRTGRFRRSWKSKNRDDEAGSYSSTVYSTMYGLTHLLTDGHDIYTSRGGPYGRVSPAHPVGFMQAACEAGREAMERKAGLR